MRRSASYVVSARRSRIFQSLEVRKIFDCVKLIPQYSTLVLRVG